MAKVRSVDLNTKVIEMKDIVKKFGNFVANDHINLTVHKGEIHAILGENGAGKSTLMNVLYGLYRPTEGEIYVKGVKQEFDGPGGAIKAGIGMVHQHFMLVQPFTVTENIVLGMEPVKGITLDMKKAREDVVAISEKYGIPVIEDAAEGMGSRFDGQVLGTFGRFGVLSFNGNKMITTSGGGALICGGQQSTVNGQQSRTPAEDANEIMWYATQARDAYPYYEHTAIGYNYRMSNVCAGIGRGQMTVLDAHIAHHKHVQELYKELLKDVKGVTLHEQPADPRYDSNFWLCAATLDPNVKVKGQENAYKEVIKSAVGGAAGVIKAVESATTDCQPNDNVEALRVFMLEKKVECRPVWKPMHKQPVYTGVSGELKVESLENGVIRQTSAKSVAYINGVSEEIFKVGFCLPAGPYVSDDDVRYIVDCIKEAIVSN